MKKLLWWQELTVCAWLNTRGHTAHPAGDALLVRLCNFNLQVYLFTAKQWPSTEQWACRLCATLAWNQQWKAIISLLDTPSRSLALQAVSGEDKTISVISVVESKVLYQLKGKSLSSGECPHLLTAWWHHLSRGYEFLQHLQNAVIGCPDNIKSHHAS